MLHLILGPPRSGVGLLSRCLELLGLHPPELQLNAPTINNLLFQDLGLSPYAVTLPRGWINTQAAETARHRIRTLLQSLASSDKNYAIADSLLCHTLPLWQQEIEKVGLDPSYIFIIRHPFEAALSLQAYQGIDIQRGHILWLAHTRAVLHQSYSQFTNYQITNNKIITFDQLLADPVSTINNALGSLLTYDLRPLTSDLLDFVQPSPKHHHAADLPDQDRQTYKPYEEIYNQNRISRYSALAQKDELAGSSKDPDKPSSKESIPFCSSTSMTVD